ncbi:MAG: methyltransferase domain-containing protein [Spirochaetota bacterium]
MKLDDESIFNLLIEEAEDKIFSGWDFSYITKTGRNKTEPLKWSYTSKILPYIRNAKSMLDMGTGGGEYLTLLQPFPETTFATESYKPNIPIARERLNPFGIEVMEVIDDDNLPFKSEMFDLIINRHESYNPDEVYRILMKKGLFISQQVGGDNDIELNKRLGAEIDESIIHWKLEYAVTELETSGFTILEKKEDFPKTRYYDTGAVVYQLKAIPWQISDFTADKYKDKLFELHKEIRNNGYIEIKSHRFLIIAEKNE